MGGPANWVVGRLARFRHRHLLLRSAARLGTTQRPAAVRRRQPADHQHATTAGGSRLKGDSFDPAVDRTIQPASFFPAQPANTFGNMTRYNPKFRSLPNLNENISFAKSFPIKEQVRLDFRAEMFNAFNRVRFGLGSLSLQSQTFGVLSQTAGDQANSPRQIQLALKLYF